MSPRISEEQKELRRQHILEAAKQVFTAKGYSATTLKDIVEQADMSRGWIYLYFESKEQIFEAILEQQDKEFDEYVKRMIAANSKLWPVIKQTFTDLQEALVQTAIDGNGLFPVFYEYFITAWREAERAAYLLRRYNAGVARLTHLIQLGVDLGQFRPLLPISQIAKIIASFQEGIVAHSCAVGPIHADAKQQFDAFIAYVHDILNVQQ